MNALASYGEWHDYLKSSKRQKIVDLLASLGPAKYVTAEFTRRWDQGCIFQTMALSWNPLIPLFVAPLNSLFDGREGGGSNQLATDITS